MNHICSRCKLTSPDGNLWCQEVDCPAGTLPTLLNYGDYIGNIKILELRRVLPNAVIYKAERGFEKDREVFFLKLANPTQEDVDYLQREAEELRKISQHKINETAIPVWKPHGSVNEADAYGVCTLRISHDDQNRQQSQNQTRYYYLMQFVEGDFLSDMLLDNPMPWHKHVGWFMLTLSEGVIALEKISEKLHMNLNPDVILVHKNNAEVPLPLLLDMGLLERPEKVVPASEVVGYQHHLKPAYTPIELIEGGRLSNYVDVYSLGMIMFEMLAGNAAYESMLRQNEEIYDDVKLITPMLTREDLPEINLNKRDERQVLALIDIVNRSIHRDRSDHYKFVSELRGDLFALYDKVEDKFRFNFEWLFRRIGIAIVALFTIVFAVYVLLVLVRAITQ